MKSFIRLTPLLFLTAFYSCDILENDAVPNSQDPLQLQEEVFSMPNTPLVFDLRKSLNTAEDGTLRTSVQPKKGTLSFMDQGFIRYSPNSNFTSGSDFFVMEALTAKGTVMDVDTINIIMVSDTTELPCFNGALSDDVRTFVNGHVTFNVIKNDGYCKDETNGAIVEIISQPVHGDVQLKDLFTYTYTPDKDYVGKDSMIYSLELVDLEGKSHFSTALVNFTIRSLGDTCEIKLNDDFFHFEEHDGNGLALPVMVNDKLCGTGVLDIFIKEQPFNGSAEVYYPPASNFTQIKYYPSTSATYFIDTLTYGAYDEKGILHLARVAIEIDLEGCTFQLEDDFYEIGADSLSNEPVGIAELDVLLNDEICNWTGIEYGISNDNQSQGEATFVSGRIHYAPPIGFTGADTVRYMVCETSECQRANVFINVK